MGMYDSEGGRAARVRLELVRLVSTQGSAALDDVRRVRAMLADAVPGATGEANLIGLALGAGVATRIRDGASVEATVSELQSTGNVQPADARWAVESIAEALGVPATAPRPIAAGVPAEAAHTALPDAPAASPAGQAQPGDLEVSTPGGTVVARPGAPTTIGRDPASGVVVDTPAVSRRHAELSHGPTGWTFSDLGSTQGSFSGGSRVTQVLVEGPTEVVLGQGSDSVALRLVPAAAFPEVAAPLPPAAAPPGSGPLRPALDADQLRPGGALAAAAAAPTEVSGPGLDTVRATLGTQSRTVAPGGVLTIGREDDNDLVASGGTVSRAHARVEHLDGRWHLVDLGSGSGTWLAGQRIERVALEGRQEFMLGDPSRGDTLVTQAAVSVGGPAAAGPGLGGPGVGTPPVAATSGGRSRTWWIVGAAVAAVLAIIAGVSFVAMRGSDDPEQVAKPAPTADDLAQATVYLEAGNYAGSGVIVDAEQGLIVTNAHVAAPASPGMGISTLTFADEQADNPDDVLIAVSTGLDQSAEPRFFGKVVAADGYLDAAVIKIEKKLSGAPAEAADLADLVAVPLGDSDALKSSDEISFFGYPGAADSSAPTFTEGVVSGPVQDDRIGEFRAEINTTATISYGNSGGLAANSDLEMVGLATWLRKDADGTGVFSSFRPINLVKPVIEAAQQGEAYSSPYAEAAPRSARVVDDGVAYGAPTKAGRVSDTCDDSSQTGDSGFAALEVTYKNLSGKGDHTDVYATISDGGRVIARSITTFPTKLRSNGCMTLTFDQVIPYGSHDLKIGVGGDLRVILDKTYDFS